MPAYRDKRDGRWRYRKWITLPNGTRTRVTGTPATDTKVAAEAAERAHIDRVLHPERMRATVDAAVPERKEMPTIEEFADRFLREYLPRQKPTERKSKEYILSGSIVPFFGAMRLDEIDQTHVNGFVRTQRVATKTVNNRLSVLATMLRYAGPSGCKLIPETELRFHVKAMSPDIVAVPIAEVAKLIAAATDARYRVAVLLASEAGLRIGEIRGLQHTDVRDGQLTVRRAIDQFGNVTTPKHDKRRAVPLSPALLAALPTLPKRGLWVLAQEDGEPMNYERMLEGIHALYAAAEVEVPVSESGVTMPWHSLRHTFGTECAARGVPVPVNKELMGHASIATTMRYVTVTSGQLDAAIRQAFGQRVGNGSAEAENSKSLEMVDSPGIQGT
jgi:integrase